MNNLTFLKKIKTPQVIILLMAVVAVNFYFFGYLDHRTIKLEGDESEYNSYAVNIVSHGIYSMDGKTFSAWREPGYILFISGIYKIFGVGNVRAIQITQTMLVLMTALFIYFIFARQKRPELGVIGSFMIVANPYFGHLSARLLPEIFFTFLLAGVLFLIISLVEIPHPKPVQLVYFGLALGVLSLTRLHFMYFPLALVGVGHIWQSRFSVFTGKNALRLLVAFIIPLAMWGLYCLGQSGKFMLQESRVEIQLFVRAQRVQEPWPELIRYTGFQIKSTFLGQINSWWWGKDYRYIIPKYNPLINTKSESISIILGNSTKYVLGNFVEFLKLISVYHAFAAPYFSKYLRVGVYLTLYGIFARGIFLCWNKKKITDTIAIAFLFILYNAAIISCFNAEPRYNVPFHIFYIVIGLTGLGMLSTDERNAIR